METLIILAVSIAIISTVIYLAVKTTKNINKHDNTGGGTGKMTKKEQ